MDLIFILSRINSVKREAIKRYTARWPTCGNQYSNLSIRPEDDSISFNHIEERKPSWTPKVSSSFLEVHM